MHVWLSSHFQFSSPIPQQNEWWVNEKKKKGCFWVMEIEWWWQCCNSNQQEKEKIGIIIKTFYLGPSSKILVPDALQFLHWFHCKSICISCCKIAQNPKFAQSTSKYTHIILRIIIKKKKLCYSNYVNLHSCYRQMKILVIL